MGFSFLLALTLQSASLPPAVPLPPPSGDEAAVLAPVERLFAGLKSRNSAAILAELRSDGRAVAVMEDAAGGPSVKSLSFAEFAGSIKPGAERLEEKFLGRPAIEVDGNIAMVWAPYVFTVDGKVSHCGTNHIGLVRDGGTWKIASIHWTQRKTGCPAS